MSDDRFKQARRSLIDRNRQRRQSDSHEPGDDDFHEDEKTLMVSIDRFGPSADAASNEVDFAEQATQMVDIAEFRARAGAAVEESTMPSREALSADMLPTQMMFTRDAPPAAQVAPDMAPTQMMFTSDAPPAARVAPDQAPTQMMFASDAPPAAQFVPDKGAAGHQGHTEFININELSAHLPPPATMQVISDPVLRQNYQFSPDAIQQGDVTLIFAQNRMGQPVVLRQVWAGDPNAMPPDWRQRLAQLEALKVPRLVTLNTVVASSTGVWAEMAKPDGYRLSAVLAQHGPQAQDVALNWLKEACEVIEAVHAAGLLYANMTPDAVWIQADNSIMLEPFDLLSFAHRGDLGDFGPPELKRPPQDRQLSAATDVFSLAAVATAALTGLPLDPAKLNAHEDTRVAKRLQAALAANPAERPQSPQAFISQFRIKARPSEGGAAKFSLDPAQLDIKVVAAIAVLLLGGFAGYMYWNQQQAAKAAAQAQYEAEVANPPPLAANDDPSPAPPVVAGGGALPAGAPPLSSDSRLTVITSFQNNPPSAGDEAPQDPEALATRSQQLLDEARGHIKAGTGLASTNEQRAEFISALQKVTESIRLRGSAPNQEERALLDQLHAQQVVREHEDRLRERISQAMDKGDISSARLAYKDLHTIDYHAGSVHFFGVNTTASVRNVNTSVARRSAGEDGDD